MKPLPRLARVRDGAPWRRVAARLAAVATGAVLVVALAGWTFGGQPARPAKQWRPMSGQVRAVLLGPTPRPAPSARSKFRGIILPDLLIVVPKGLTRAAVGKLQHLGGVRKLIAFDGARIAVGGVSASVVGVNPSQFRSWVPLRTASDQRLWTEMARGDFIAGTGVATRLGLVAARRYRLTGSSAVTARFAGAARLGIAGVDLVVNQSVSRKLGLVHQVAALVSAPGASITGLVTEVKRALGSRVSLVDLRGQPASVPQVPRHITNYLQLFQASSAKYCPALSWTVLAAIGQIESADGRNLGPSSAGALGPMQFLPSTWAAWGIDGFGPPGPPDIMNPFDAVPSAARMLCADGASAGTGTGLRQAIFDYNHAGWYVADVLALAAQYAAEYR